MQPQPKVASQELVTIILFSMIAKRATVNITDNAECSHPHHAGVQTDPPAQDAGHEDLVMYQEAVAHVSLS